MPKYEVMPTPYPGVNPCNEGRQAGKNQEYFMCQKPKGHPSEEKHSVLLRVWPGSDETWTMTWSGEVAK